MSIYDWIGIGVIALVIVGVLVLLNQITKPYDVKTEEEFQKRRKESAGMMVAGLKGLQQILDPQAKKSVEVQQDLRRGIYDDKEEPDDPPDPKARVIWLDNDSGCKGVCEKADYRDLTGSSNPRWCAEQADCVDEILLDGLESIIRLETRDTLVVLHIKGSHGPAYYKRYPAAFEKFTPVCKTSDLPSCTQVELRNAYDNSILYTDHVVGEVVRLADKLQDRFASAVFYVSDHGESLGENGLYLHGMPYAVAPDEQTHVPLFAWISRSFLQLEHWDTACMARASWVNSAIVPTSARDRALPSLPRIAGVKFARV